MSADNPNEWKEDLVHAVFVVAVLALLNGGIRQALIDLINRL